MHPPDQPELILAFKLRLKICRSLFVVPKIRLSSPVSLSAQMLATCSTISDEAAPTLYGENVFVSKLDSKVGYYHGGKWIQMWLAHGVKPMSQDIEVLALKYRGLIKHLVVVTKSRWTFEPRAVHQELLGHYRTLKHLKTLCVKTQAVQSLSGSMIPLPPPTRDAPISVPIPYWSTYILHFLRLVPEDVKIVVSYETPSPSDRRVFCYRAILDPRKDVGFKVVGA